MLASLTPDACKQDMAHEWPYIFIVSQHLFNLLYLIVCKVLKSLENGVSIEYCKFSMTQPYSVSGGSSDERLYR